MILSTFIKRYLYFFVIRSPECFAKQFYLDIFDWLAVPVTWGISKTTEKKLYTIENKWLRRMLKFSYKEHVTSDGSQKNDANQTEEE